VETANNAGAALFLLEQMLFSVILTDYMMPGLSGLELADLLRRFSRTAAIPVILMSAFPPPDVETRVAAVISKPFELDELLRVVRQCWPQ
jgi:CheY-like chemotaxis protein